MNFFKFFLILFVFFFSAKLYAQNQSSKNSLAEQIKTEIENTRDLIFKKINQKDSLNKTAKTKELSANLHKAIIKKIDSVQQFIKSDTSIDDNKKDFYSLLSDKSRG